MDAKTLKSTRELLKHTQASFATLLGIGRRALIRYESGERPVPDNVARRLKTLPQPKAVLARNEGQVTPERFPRLYTRIGKGAKQDTPGQYHPFNLFPELPWSRDASGAIVADCCPAVVLFTERYAQACEARYAADVAKWGSNSRLPPPTFTLEPDNPVDNSK